MRCRGYFRHITIEKVSLAILIGLLLVSGVGVFLWMAALKWKDMIGLSVGVIFLLLAATQVMFNVIWAMSVQKHKMKMASNVDTKQAEFMQESVMTEYPNAASI